MIDMYMNVHVCTVIQIYMSFLNLWKHLRGQQPDEVSRATLVVSYKRDVLTMALGRGAQQTVSMVAVGHEFRITVKYMNVQMYNWKL